MTDSSSSSAEARRIRAGGVAAGRAGIPPSKSLTHRAFALALLARTPLRIEHPLEAEDTRLFLAALVTLGCAIERRGDAVTIQRAPSPAAGHGRLYFGNAGTPLRFCVALAAVVPGTWELDGTARLRERPVGPLVEALRALGVRIDCHGAPGCVPLVVHGGGLPGGRVRLDAGESSQYLSALLLAGQAAAGPLEIEVPALVSAPYVELTVDLIRRQGGRIEHPAPGLWISRPGDLAGGAIDIEPDFSAAAYPAAAAALTGGDILLARLSPASLQGDRRWLDLLARMGADVRPEAGGIRVRGSGALAALTADLSDIPDQVPTLAALAPFARGTTRISNVAHLRLKESDRLAAMASELTRAGALVTELPDGLEIAGSWADAPPPATPVVVDPHGDHRIAMAMALVGLRRPGLAIADPGCVGKSWPGFWDGFAAWSGAGREGR